MTKNAPFVRRLTWAWQGIRAAYAGERSFRTQAWASGAVVGVLCVLRPGWMWTAVIILLAVLVLMAELFNTALESLLDGLHPGHGDFVRKAKDCAAGAVLAATFAAVAGGVAMIMDVLPGRLA